MRIRMKLAVGLALSWIAILIIVAFIAGCTTAPETLYEPASVDTPVAVTCKIPAVPKQPDLLLALPGTATLTQGLKACLAQHDFDLAYTGELEAAITTCQ
jgi:hypothetical protein